MLHVFIMRRLLYLIPTLILITLLCFIVINLPPGDMLDDMRRGMLDEGYSRETIESILSVYRERYGLDQPIFIQYFNWITSFLQGDFGYSVYHTTFVRELIGERLLFSMLISFFTLIFTWIVAIPIGIYSATHKYTVADYFFTFIGFVGLSIPNFFLALVLMVMMLFVFDYPITGGLFSSEYAQAPWSVARFLDFLRHIWIPIVVIGTAGTASLLRIMRGNLLEVLGQPFVDTARSKGLSEWVVVYKHAVRVAINPIISIMGMQLPRLISGEIIVAIVLSLPTLGPLLFGALVSQDMYLAGAILVFLALALVLGNLLADIGLALVDPRITYE